MNWQSGLTRLALVTGLLWALGWSYYAYLGTRKGAYALEEIRRLDERFPKGFNDPIYREQHLFWMMEMNEGSEMLAMSVQIGLFVPVALLILFPFGWFVYRGFRTKGK